MPWCDPCDRFYNPTSLTEDGECPTCGDQISEKPKVPWHFWLVLALAACYLIWRAAQGILLLF
jgi:hypothetical protein